MAKLTILGCSSAIPTISRFPSSFALEMQNRLFLIDAGEGCQTQIRKYKVRLQRIEKIFITHLHGDHFFGLVGAITTMQLLGRKAPLVVYGFHGLENVVRAQLSVSGSKILFDLKFVELKHEHYCVFEDDTIAVWALPLNHRISCVGFKFVEKPKPRRINGPAAKEAGVPHYFMLNLRKGEDYDDGNKVYPNAALTFDAHPSLSYVHITDTLPVPELAPLVEGADLLYHEATFASDLKDRALATHHSTGQEAAQFAKEAKAKKLVLGHYSARYLSTSPIKEEAIKEFDAVIMGADGLEIEF